MSRPKCSPVNPGCSDVYTLHDGSRWSVVSFNEGVVEVEEIGTSIVNIRTLRLADLLRAVAGWSRACRP